MVVAVVMVVVLVMGWSVGFAREGKNFKISAVLRIVCWAAVRFCGGQELVLIARLLSS